MRTPAFHRSRRRHMNTELRTPNPEPRETAQPLLDALHAKGVAHAVFVGEVQPMADVHLIFR